MSTVRARSQGPAEGKMVAEIRVYADPRLKDLAGDAADREGLPLSEYVVKVLAQQLGRPELAIVPRKKSGRPRKPAVA
jgi:hypothetical protein